VLGMNVKVMLVAPPAYTPGTSSSTSGGGSSSSGSGASSSGGGGSSSGGSTTSPLSGYPAVQEFTLDQLITAGNSLLPTTTTTTTTEQPTTTGGSASSGGGSSTNQPPSSSEDSEGDSDGSQKRNVLAIALPVVLAVGLVAAVGMVTVRIMRMKAAARVAHASMAGGLTGGRVDQFTNLHALSERGELSPGSAVGATARKRTSITQFHQGTTLAAAVAGGSGRAAQGALPEVSPRTLSNTSGHHTKAATGAGPAMTSFAAGAAVAAAGAKPLLQQHNSPRAAAASPGQMSEGSEGPADPEEAKLPVSRNASAKAAATDHFGLQSDLSARNAAAAPGGPLGASGAAASAAAGMDGNAAEGGAGPSRPSSTSPAPGGRKTLPPLQLGPPGARLSGLTGVIRDTSGGGLGNSSGKYPVPGELLSPGWSEEGSRKRLG